MNCVRFTWVDLVVGVFFGRLLSDLFYAAWKWAGQRHSDGGERG